MSDLSLPAEDLAHLCEVVEHMRRTARNDVEWFTVSFVKNFSSAGSGTLVTAHGRYGILTANHVASNLFDRSGNPPGLIYTKEAAATFLNSNQVKIAELAYPESREYSEAGPDLAFVEVIDPELLSALKAKKSFYDLTSTVELPFELGYQPDLHPTPWVVVGAPAALEKHKGEPGTSDHILSATHFAGDAEFLGVDEIGGHDLLTFKVDSGVNEFPENYEGVSGGGIWFSPFAIDDSTKPPTPTVLRPMLAGVVFFQTEEIEKERNLIAHGPRSTYRLLLEYLKGLSGG